MVWHDHPSAQRVALAVEMTQRVCHNLGGAFAGEQAGTGTGIKPFFHPPGELFVIVAAVGFRPRFGVGCEPEGSFPFKLFQFLGG